MIYSHEDLLKIIHDTKAVSIWNSKNGPVFWYTANVPGPFYVNTEKVIGNELSAQILKKITEILASTTDLATRAAKLNETVLEAYNKDENYRNIISTMVDAAKNNFPSGSYSLISGGERRDWLFSIPFAKEVGVKHAFLFSTLETYCEQEIKSGETALHIADLINNAASYFDKWFPALEKAHLNCAGTVCINTNGTVGLGKLKKIGFNTIVLNIVDGSFFEKSCAEGLVSPEIRDELNIYFASSKEWAIKYLLGNEKLFNVKNTDPKSLDRMKKFFTNDPWSLRSSNEPFFSSMLSEIAKRSS